jgi:hypothetical protein
MAFFAGAGFTDVNKYRACLIGYDGHISNYRAFVCDNDTDAIIWARQLVDGHHDVELWNGDRLVRRLERQDVRLS